MVSIDDLHCLVWLLWDLAVHRFIHLTSHATPPNFGEKNSQAIIGIQMASAYVGSTFMPPLFGLIANHISVGLLPVYVLFFLILMFFMLEKTFKLVK